MRARKRKDRGRNPRSRSFEIGAAWLWRVLAMARETLARQEKEIKTCDGST